MEKTKLFGDVLNGKLDESVFDQCSLEDINKMINSAASRKQRVVDAVKYERVIQLETHLKELRSTLTIKPTGIWHTVTPDDLTLEDINKAVKCAQSFKCMYGPAKQKVWKKIAADRNDPRFEMATRNLEIAPDRYKQSLVDEDYWISIRDRRFPEGTSAIAHSKNDKLRALVAELESRKKISAADTIILEQLKSLL